MQRPRLHLLSGFALDRAGVRVALPHGMQRLVAFLALTGPVHRCVVAGTMWREVPEDHAMASLRTAIWRLNRLVPGLVHVEELRVTLAPEVPVDSDEQEAFATRVLDHGDRRAGWADEHWVAEGVDCLAGGALLPGWYDDWVVQERERLTQLRVHALERLASAWTECGRLDLALQLALDAVRIEPLRETANAVLMSVYLAEGNVADAVRQYDGFAAMLHRELGVDPSPSLGALLPTLARH